MKVALIGAGGTRTPLLVNGLARSDLPIEEVALYDTDRERLDAMAALSACFAGRVRLERCSRPEIGIEGAAFVFLSIRVGGESARARDEAVALAHGVLGQETVGPAGFALAVRNIPALVEYARAVEALAPDAWVINFTNPVSIATQAMTSQTKAKVLGICDTPIELFEAVAAALDVPPSECFFDYFGLNHLGWLRQVYHRGEPQIDRLWDRAERLYRAPLFPTEKLRALGLLPTEYLYFYYSTAEALANIRRAGETRGQSLERLNRRLFSDLSRPGAPLVSIYEAYLREREASYLRSESGSPPSSWVTASGYDKIALEVARALYFDTGRVIPLDVRNRGNLSLLEPEDVVEVPCRVDRNGAFALHVPEVPEAVRDLLEQVKRYERATVKASLSGEKEHLVAALAENPLVDDLSVARDLIESLALR